MEAYFGTTLTHVTEPNANIKKVIDKAYRDAVYDFYKHAFKHQLIANFMEKGEAPVDNLPPLQLKLLNEAKDRLTTKPPYILLTVNAKPEITYKEFDQKITKFANRKIVSAYKYVYEIRKQDQGNYTGMHCHMLIKYNCKPYDFKRAAKSTFKNICNVNHKDILNFRYVNEDELNDKLEYLKGNKKESKLAGVELTKEWRHQKGILDIYESATPLGMNIPLLGCAENDLIVD